MAQSDTPGSQPAGLRPTTLRQLATSTLWVIAARWSLRLIGVFSTIVLARILTPLDYGLIALATLVMGFLQILSETGQRLALIRLQRIERAHYDTAWTIGIIIGLLISAGMVAIAPAAADYFGEPRLDVVIYVLALRPILFGFENIGIVEYRRDLRFDLELRFLVVPRLLSFVVTLCVALWWRNYWALVVGILANQVFSLVYSYWIHDFRPRFSLSRLAELWGMSIWTLVGTIGRYVGDKTDELVIGRRFDTAELGVYTVVGSTAAMPVDELTSAPSRALYSGFSRLNDDIARLRDTYLDALGVLYAVAIASAIGVCAVAHDLVLVLLGEQWLMGVAVVPYLAIATAISGIGATDNALLNAVGRPRVVALRTWLFAVSLGASMMVVPPTYGIQGIAAARLASAAVMMIAIQSIVLRHLGLGFGPLLARIWRPLLAAAAAYSVVVRCAVIAIEPAFLRLVICIGAGALVQVSVQIALWLVVGRPRGVESFLADAVRRVASRLRPSSQA